MAVSYQASAGGPRAKQTHLKHLALEIIDDRERMRNRRFGPGVGLGCLVFFGLLIVVFLGIIIITTE